MDNETTESIRARVQEMYERHPYPPVDEDIAAYKSGEAWLLESPNPSFHLYWPARPYTEDLDILIAGCGTQQAAQVAAGLPGARIVGTDISEHSLSETRRLADKIGVGNLTLEKRPIERTGELGRDFDLVICTGVLHHLADPDVGLKALASVLRPGGSMHLMVYGRHGRTGVYMLQELFRALGVDAGKVGKKDIAALRTLIENLPPAHPFAAVRDMHPDWQDDEGLVDLLLHVQDRAYTLSDIDGFLTGAGLKMQKLLFAGRTDPMFTPLYDVAGKGFAKQRELEQRTAVELYRASVKKHVFIACHEARPDQNYETSVAKKSWAETVPVISYGLEVERPNETRKTFRITWPFHNEPGIAVETTENGMRLLEAFDGNRTIADAVQAIGFKKNDKALLKQLEGFLERCARADFLTFRKRVTSSD
ncbi:MAG: class I SAM-dependent methyltransferase [Rhodospirillales bacterium]|nr:class I SAM-dependent methyltransferase [Rhodospirillales bacterium]